MESQADTLFKITPKLRYVFSSELTDYTRLAGVINAIYRSPNLFFHRTGLQVSQLCWFRWNRHTTSYIIRPLEELFKEGARGRYDLDELLKKEHTHYPCEKPDAKELKNELDSATNCVQALLKCVMLLLDPPFLHGEKCYDAHEEALFKLFRDKLSDEEENLLRQEFFCVFSFISEHIMHRARNYRKKNDQKN